MGDEAGERVSDNSGLGTHTEPPHSKPFPILNPFKSPRNSVPEDILATLECLWRQGAHSSIGIALDFSASL